MPRGAIDLRWGRHRDRTCEEVGRSGEEPRAERPVAAQAVLRVDAVDGGGKGSASLDAAVPVPSCTECKRLGVLVSEPTRVMSAVEKMMNMAAGG